MTTADTLTEVIRVFLVEDQELVRQGLVILLQLRPDFQVVGEAGNGLQALEQIELLWQTELQPDVVLMDIRMPIVDGVKATQVLCQRYPNIKVLVLTTFNNDQYVAEALRYGARGYLLKDTPFDELADVIRQIYRGYTQLGPGILERIVSAKPPTEPTQPEKPPPEFHQLSDRERQVLCLVAQGASNREIARTIYLSEGTVRNHISRILTRLNLRDRTQAAIVANSYLDWLKASIKHLPDDGEES